MPDYAQKDPSNLLLGQPDGTFVEGAEAAGILSFDRGRGAALADLNLDGLLDLVEVNLGAAGEAVAERRRPATAEAPAPMGHWLGAPARPARRRTATRSARGSRSGSATGRSARELTVGGGHVERPARLDPLSGSGRRRDAEVRVTWPDGEVGPWLDVAGRRVRRHRARRHRRPTRGRRRDG